MIIAGGRAGAARLLLGRAARQPEPVSCSFELTASTSMHRCNLQAHKWESRQDVHTLRTATSAHQSSPLLASMTQ